MPFRVGWEPGTPRDDHFQDVSITGNLSPSETTRVLNDWVPSPTVDQDLGTSALRWRKLWVQDVDVSGSLVGAASSDAAAGIQYVDSSTGLDGDNGLTWQNAKATFSSAHTALPAGGGVIYSVGNHTLSSDPFTGMTKNVQVIILTGTITCNVAVVQAAVNTIFFTA